jgi:hypothetical protein
LSLLVARFENAIVFSAKGSTPVHVSTARTVAFYAIDLFGNDSCQVICLE